MREHRAQTLAPPHYWRTGDVCEYFSASREWVRRRCADENHPFPKPIRFGHGVNAHKRWLRESVLAWEAARVAQEAATLYEVAS